MAKTPAKGGPSDVAIQLTRTEALALVRMADTGLRVTEALALIPNIRAAETALNKLRAAV